MKQFYMILYFILLGYSINMRNIIFILSMFAFGVLILAFVPFYKKLRKNSIKNHINQNFDGAVLNVNKASWWEIEELPGFQKVSAKKVVWMRKHNGKYKSKEDFYLKNNVKNKKEIENLISF